VGVFINCPESERKGERKGERSKEERKTENIGGERLNQTGVKKGKEGVKYVSVDYQ